MNDLFEIKPVDRKIYQEEIKDFLPEKIIDIHTHIWPKELNIEQARNTQKWPAKVAECNPIEDLMATYELMLPGKQVIPLVFSTIPRGNEKELNVYVQESSQRYHFPGLVYSLPTWEASNLEEQILKGGFLGVKCYLSHAPEHLDPEEIRIFDYFPHHQLEVLNKHGWMMMCHIPRSGRLRDPQNLADMIEIEQKYPNIKLIIAHVGRAYCNEDVGNAFEALADTEKMFFDISANCNQWVFEQLIKTVGSERILFGSDMPILRMRTRRICENGTYINLVPTGLYGDVTNDPHLREVNNQEDKNLTFFLYEEIISLKQAAKNCGLTKEEIEKVFYQNANQIFGELKWVSV